MKDRHLFPCILALATLAATASSLVAADLRLPRIFGDPMVLQRDKPVLMLISNFHKRGNAQAKE